MAYDAGTAFLQIVPSFQGVVTRIAAEAEEWGAVAGEAFKSSFESIVGDLNIGTHVDTATALAEAEALKEGLALLDPDLVFKYEPIEDPAAAALVAAELDALAHDREVDMEPTLSPGFSAKFLASLALLGAAGGKVLWGNVGSMSFIQLLLSPLTAVMTLFSAGLGSIGQFAGFGPEHLIMTLVGLIASATAAFLGAGLLFLGAVGVFATGFVTDLGGIGQALGDIKTVSTALSTYQTETEALNKQIPQTAAAQAALNTALAGFAPAARSAVLAAALTANQFHWMYDEVTAVAESIGAQILNQAMQVGEKFLPTLGRYAAVNMGIIQKDLQPLFSWLSTTGLTIFTNLENIFTAHLPTAMAVLTQGIELLLKTINLVAPDTGGFMSWLDKLLTYLNGPGWAKWAKDVTDLIADFRMWAKFAELLVTDIADLFGLDADTAGGIVKYLTQGLELLHKWIKSTTGSEEIHTIFEVHKKEIIALIAVVIPLIAAFVKLYLAISPWLVTAVTDVLVPMAKLLDLIASNQVGALALDFLLITARMGILLPLLAAFGIDLAGLPAAAGAAAAGLIGLDDSLPIGLALLANPVMWGIAAGAAALLAVNALESAIKKTLAQYSQLDTSTLTTGIGRGFAADIDPAILKKMADDGDTLARVEYDAYERKLKELQKTGVSPGNNPFQNLLDQLGDIASGNIVTRSFEKLWQQITEGLQGLGTRLKNWAFSIPGDIGAWMAGWGTPVANWFTGIPAHIGGWLASWGGDLEKWFTSIPGHIEGWLKSWGTDIKNWFTALPGSLGNVGNTLLGIGKDLVDGLLTGIQDAWKTITGWIGTAIGDLSSVAKKVLGISSPSTVFYGIGQNIGQGLVNGLLESETAVTAAGRKMVSGLGLLSNSAIMASVGVSGAVSLTNPGSGSVLAALQRIETAVVQVPSATAAGISTKVDSRLVNVFQQQTRTALQVARAGG